MKSFKGLTLLSLAAVLCGANGFPTVNVTIDSFTKRQSKEELQNFLKPASLNPIVSAAWDASNGDNAKFTQNFVNGLADNNKHYNYVVCRVKHSYNFDGAENVAWAHLYIQAEGESYNYDLVIGGSGTFTRKDVGGYINWAWRGTVPHDQDLHGYIVKFLKPGSPTGAIQIGGSS